MRKWLTTLSVVAVLAGAALTVHYWLPALLNFAKVNSDEIQAITDLAQGVIWVAAGLWFVLSLWFRSRRNAPQASPANNRELSISGEKSNNISNTGSNNIFGNQIGGDAVGRDKIVINNLNVSTAQQQPSASGGDTSLPIKSLDVALLSNVCRKVTTRLAHELIDNQRIISREDFRTRLDQFLASSTRYSFVLGSSGVDISTAMAIEAQRLLENGWTVLLVRGRDFTLEHAATRVSEELSHPSLGPTWHQIVEPWAEEVSAPPSRFALLIDAIDKAAHEDVSRQLLSLHDSISDAPLEQLKVIISCHDVVWNDSIRDRILPLEEDVEHFGRRTGRGYKLLYISDFTADELERALRSIGDTELLSPGCVGEWVDPHIATLRELLKHPATFGHYAALHESGDASSIHNLTWSGLIEHRLRKALVRAAPQCGKSPDELRAQLLWYASLARQQKARDFLLSVSVIKESLPELYVAASRSLTSPYTALLEQGVLHQSQASGSEQAVSFRITDAGGYLLSFELEQEANGKAPDELRGIVTEWLQEAWNYSPILDALLAWIDRLALTPHNPQLRMLIEILAEQHRSSDLFRLMRPTVMSSLFEIIKSEDVEDFYLYRDVAVEVRSSPKALAEIHRHLIDPNPQARQLAARLVGVHRDVSAASKLVTLLEDKEEDVRHEAYTSFGHIGKAALPALLQALNDTSTSEERRSRCVIALRNVGFRDEEVSRALAECLRHAQAKTNAELLQTTLLTAAHLRDTGHTSFAIAALHHPDGDVAQAAAKLLTEVPDPSAFNTLRDALRPQYSPTGEIVERYWLPRQLMAALLKTDQLKAEPVILDLISDALSGTGELSPAEVVSATEKLGLPAAYSLVLENTVSQLTDPPSERNIVWHSTQMLGRTWEPKQLTRLAATTAKVLEQGVDLAKLFVDAIAPGMQIHDEFPLGNRLNRVSDLLAVAKSRAANFVPEASRLLGQARELSSAELSRLLWIVGDARAEEALLGKIEQPAAEGQRVWYERNSVIRALGTCGTERGAAAVLNYLRTQKEISIYFPEETLCPLVRRGLLLPDELFRIVRDSNISVQGRTCSLVALGILDSPAYRDLFAGISGSDEEDEILQRYAVRMLGFTKDSSVIPALHRLLRTSSRQSIKSQAAEALGRLNARQTVHDIERALEDSYASGFVNALASFQEESSLSLLINGLRTASHEHRAAYLAAIGSFSHYPRGREIIREQFEGWSSSNVSIFDEQSALIEGLARHDPDMLLERFNRHYDSGNVRVSACQRLAQLVPRMFRAEATDKSLLMGAVKRLACDRHVIVREYVTYILERTNPAFCHQLYNELRHAPDSDEWSQACAVNTLGFWSSDIAEIETARHAEDLLVRRAADAALVMRERRQHLQHHIEQYQSRDGLARLAAYLCLKEQGDVSTIRTLYDVTPEQATAHIFLRQLTEQINNRLRNDNRKKEEEEKKLATSRGTIWFD
jgi:HEAT repeat protein